jgi:NAD(P)-dependent dehydrogenase (short-subunit alcohol dehydrogenase family)
MKSFKEKKCLITGAASGIGRSTAVAMAKRGAALFLTDIDAKKLEETAGAIRKDGGTVCRQQAINITNNAEVEKFAESIHAEFGPMDIVMNIAGIAIWGEVDRLKVEHWRRVIDVNLMGPVHIIQGFIAPMIRAGKGGHLVNVASAAGLIALPLHAPYSASKFGLVGISEVLRYDLARHNIGVTVMCPGAVETPLKNTVEIIGVDQGNPKIIEMKRKFSDHAISPDRVASQIVRAIIKNRFLVITSADIRAAYWFKRNLFFVYNFIMKKLNKMAYNATFYTDRMDG